MSRNGRCHCWRRGAATTKFTGANTYTGGTYITQGTLQVAGGAALADNGDVYIGGAGGNLEVLDTETISGLFNGTTTNGQVTLTSGDLVVKNGHLRRRYFRCEWSPENQCRSG